MEQIEKIKEIIKGPAAFFDKLGAEPFSIDYLYKSYVLPLFGLATFSTYLGNLFWGNDLMATSAYAPSLGSTLVSFVVSLGMLYVLAMVIAKVGGYFEAKGDTTLAFNLVVFCLVPAWALQILSVLPLVGLIATLVAMIYSLYLYFTGLARVMEPDPQKAILYCLASLAAAVGLAIVAGVVVLVLSAIVGL